MSYLVGHALLQGCNEALQPRHLLICLLHVAVQHLHQTVDVLPHARLVHTQQHKLLRARMQVSSLSHCQGVDMRAIAWES